MTKAETQKQVNPTEKCSRNVIQKLSLSRNIFSDIRVATPENNSAIQPEGKQRLNENDGDFWKKFLINIAEYAILNPMFVEFAMIKPMAPVDRTSRTFSNT